jgi:hypothetical protein
MEKDEALEIIIRTKAKQMASNPNYSAYSKSIIQQLHVTQPEQAFLLGAIDAMIYDVDSSLALSRMKLSYEERQRLITEICKEIWHQE